jgi:uncharacterized protein involved in exopolysaccharide biosynthesis
MQEFSIGTLLKRARRGWYTPVVFAAVLGTLTVLTLMGSNPVYRVTMTVVPAPSDQGTESMASSSGTLTAFLGLANGGNVNFTRYQKLLSSTVVAQRLQDKYGMLQLVFATNWDAQRHVWVPHATLRNYLLDWLLKLSNLPTFSPPDATALAHYLGSQLIIVPGVANDIVTISMDSGDVVFAKRVMLAAHEQANQVLRDQVARRAQMQSSYLEGKLSQVSVADYRATLLAMLANQQKTLMLTQTDASYAGEILSPPVASATPVAPRPVLGLFVAVMVGILSGLAVVIFVGPDWWRAPLARLNAFRGRRTRGEASSVRS